MSSFVVEDRTINSVINYLARSRRAEWIKAQVEQRFGFSLDSLDGRQALGKLMFGMNIRATNDRYQGGVEDFRTMNYAYCPVAATPVQAFKAIQCWLYQCAEGDVYESEDYQFFEKVKGWIAAEIVCGLPEYEKAEWR